uniref:protochlorophyllide-dependent translocon component 52, chloroplastic-like n=1 Tax=Erigeron canadensis TaxID=72917 RepID=UPI001CB9A21F|nr:protochlorophyllide-dependent translocon component 52, chloroplastic-like [Erigeron canadensis]
MEALKVPSPVLPTLLVTNQMSKHIFSLPLTHRQPRITRFSNSKFKKFNAVSPSVSTEPAFLLEEEEEEIESVDKDEKFDWLSQWYAVMPVCDLDKRAPHGKKVMGLDVVVWWDQNEDSWKVFDDRCPHRLAPLSEGRIDQWGRLQCVYHGWCFGGSGDCKLIPQAALDGPPVHTFQKACVAVYPSTVQNGIVWFWPNTDPKHKDILTLKKPPYIPELDDPSFTYQVFARDLAYGHEILFENLLDPAHIPYAHYGILGAPQPSVKLDQEGGRPIDINVDKIHTNGFTSNHRNGKWHFVPPCLLYGSVTTFGVNPVNVAKSANKKDHLAQNPPSQPLLVFIAVPVSPGNSRLIIVSPRHWDAWIDRISFRWMYHIAQNLVMDSDLYILHVGEKKVMQAGLSNWRNVCFVPTKSDACVVAYRKWLNKYAGGQVDWGENFDLSYLPPTPPREQLMDRYWTHVVNCSSCSAAYKGLKALKVSLQVFPFAAVAIAAAIKEGMITNVARTTLVVVAVFCFVGSKWLSHYIYEKFHYHDYNHAAR